jgi:CRP-like cAMP-binding protein
VVVTLHKGSYFGEMALLLQQPRNATVACST